MVNFDVVYAGFYPGLCCMKFFIVIFSLDLQLCLIYYV